MKPTPGLAPVFHASSPPHFCPCLVLLFDYGFVYKKTLQGKCYISLSLLPPILLSLGSALVTRASGVVFTHIFLYQSASRLWIHEIDLVARHCTSRACGSPKCVVLASSYKQYDMVAVVIPWYVVPPSLVACCCVLSLRAKTRFAGARYLERFVCCHCHGNVVAKCVVADADLRVFSCAHVVGQDIKTLTP